MSSLTYYISGSPVSMHETYLNVSTDYQLRESGSGSIQSTTSAVYTYFSSGKWWSTIPSFTAHTSAGSDWLYRGNISDDFSYASVTTAWISGGYVAYVPPIMRTWESLGTGENYPAEYEDGAYYRFYKFTAPSTGDFIFYTTTSTGADTILTYYSSTEPTSLSSYVDLNDDYSGYLSQLGPYSMSNGVDYYFAVRNYNNGNSEDFDLEYTS